MFRLQEHGKQKAKQPLRGNQKLKSENTSLRACMQLLYTRVYRKIWHCLARLSALDRRCRTDTPQPSRRYVVERLMFPKDPKHTSGHSVVLKGLCSRCQSLALPKRLHMRSG